MFLLNAIFHIGPLKKITWSSDKLRLLLCVRISFFRKEMRNEERIRQEGGRSLYLQMPCPVAWSNAISFFTSVLIFLHFLPALRIGKGLTFNSDLWQLKALLIWTFVLTWTFEFRWAHIQMCFELWLPKYPWKKGIQKLVPQLTCEIT